MKTESQFKTSFCDMLRKTCDVTTIESSTGRGIPDVNICHRGIEVWTELKIFTAGRVLLRPEQYAWGMRRSVSHGGRVFVVALHPNNRLHFFQLPNLITKHGKYLALTGLCVSCEFNAEQIKTILFT